MEIILGLGPRDLERALVQYKKEKIYPMTRPAVFWGAIYAMLSATDNYSNLVWACNSMEEYGLTTPEAIIEEAEKHEGGRIIEGRLFLDAPPTRIEKISGIARNNNRLTRILKRMQYGNDNANQVYDFSKWWSDSGLYEEIIEDLRTGRKREYEIRDSINKNAPGLGMKCASLFMRMCGCENVVPVDLWMFRFLRAKGHDVEIPSKTTSGIPKGKYLGYEKIIQEFARSEESLPEFWRKPAHYQLAIWVRNSSINFGKDFNGDQGVLMDI